MNIVTAEEARNNPLSKVEEFNSIVWRTIGNGECEVYIDFSQFGCEQEDIQFILDAGYTVTRNSACLWWEVSW